MAEEAIAIEPREVLFYSLRGDVRIKQGDYAAALANYDDTVRRDSGYYRHYLVRGLLRERLGDRAGAWSDFERSVQVLPTKTVWDSLVRLNAR